MPLVLRTITRFHLVTRRSRRFAVVAAFGGIPLLGLVYLALVEPGRITAPLWVPIAIGLTVLAFGGNLVVYGYGQGRMGYPTRALDERQQMMRDRALILSYRVSSIAVGLALGALLGAALQGPLVIESTVVTPLLIAAVLYLPLLPFAALAWIEPDPPAEPTA
jgi:hypothetical protein